MHRNFSQLGTIFNTRIIGINRCRAPQLRQPAQYHAQAFRVVAVLVRNNHSLYTRGVKARLVAARQKITLANSAINKHARARFGVFDNGGVSLAAACKHM